MFVQFVSLSERRERRVNDRVRYHDPMLLLLLSLSGDNTDSTKTNQAPLVARHSRTSAVPTVVGGRPVLAIETTPSAAARTC